MTKKAMVDLYKKGWTGMNLDISKRCTDLYDHFRENDTNLNISVGAQENFIQSFIFYDAQSNRTFHINTLVYNPGRNKASHIRQLEYIAKSINTSFN